MQVYVMGYLREVGEELDYFGGHHVLVQLKVAQLGVRHHEAIVLSGEAQKDSVQPSSGGKEMERGCLEGRRVPYQR
jgi:hypothetical protein